jgi:hypothetical protein
MNEEKKSDIIELSGIISRSFSQISPGFLLTESDIKSIEELKKYLSAQIKIFLDDKYDILINMLYRIDIDDKKIEKVFSKVKREDIPDSIASLIIERQLQKIHYRKMYKDGNL